MGFLTILNYIAMGIGYIVSVLVLLFLLWVLIDGLKGRQKNKRLERESADKEKAEKILEKDAKPVTPDTTAQQNTKQTPTQTPTANTDQNKEKLVDESGKLKMTD